MWAVQLLSRCTWGDRRSTHALCIDWRLSQRGACKPGCTQGSRRVCGSWAPAAPGCCHVSLALETMKS